MPGAVSVPQMRGECVDTTSEDGDFNYSDMSGSLGRSPRAACRKAMSCANEKGTTPLSVAKKRGSDVSYQRPGSSSYSYEEC